MLVITGFVIFLVFYYSFSLCFFIYNSYVAMRYIYRLVYWIASNTALLFSRAANFCYDKLQEQEGSISSDYSNLDEESVLYY